MCREKRNEKSVAVIQPEIPPVASPPTETDLLPEFCQYRDEGCKLAASCLHCPFPQCVYEQPGEDPKLTKSQRDREIVRLYSEEKKNQRQLAARFNICQRTVARILAAAREKPKT
jgi:hypothetical protein